MLVLGRAGSSPVLGTNFLKKLCFDRRASFIFKTVKDEKFTRTL